MLELFPRQRTEPLFASAVMRSHRTTGVEHLIKKSILFVIRKHRIGRRFLIALRKSRHAIWPFHNTRSAAILPSMKSIAAETAEIKGNQPGHQTRGKTGVEWFARHRCSL